MQKKIIPSTLFVAALFLSSCSILAPQPTATPTLTSTPTALPTLTPTQTLTPTATPNPTPERASYTLNNTMDYDAHTVTVDENIIYPNHTGKQLTALVLAVEPNLWPGSFTLTGISIDGT